MDQSVTMASRQGTDVGEAWRRAHELARAWWPGVELPLQQFASHLQRLDWKHESPEHTHELYLCCACSLGCPEACRRLESEYFPALEAALHRQCGRRDFVEDVLQQVRERLLVGPAPKIASYEGKGSLSSWLQRVVRRAACDVYRKENQARRIASGWWQVVESLAPAPSSESDSSRPSDARYMGALERALLEALAQLSLEERSLLKLYYVQGLSADEISQCLGRDRSTVYRRLNHITAQVRRWSVARAREQTGIVDREELGSLFQANHMWIYLDPAVWLEPRRAEGDSANAARLKRG